MNLSLRLNDPTNCFLVAFDIVSSSQNLNNPNGLARDRELLFDAINQTKLVRQGAINKSIVGQFLGDEFRIAIPSTHGDQSVKPSRILEFIDEVFLTLDAPRLGYAPVIRAALTQGALRSKELKNVCYLYGESLLKLSDVLSAIDGKDNLLISTLELSGLQKESVNGEPLYVKRYARRLIPKPYDGSKSHDLANFFLVGVTNARTIGNEDGKHMVQRNVHQTLLDFSRICLEGFDPVRITISPSSIVFVFRESSFNASKEFLNTVRNKAGIYGSTLQLAAAIAYGPGLEIPEKDWLAETFESGTAIQLCRILSKLPAGSLAMPDDPEYTELFSPLSRSLNEQLSLHGKRQEVFNCRINRDYFPKEDRPDSDRQPPTPLQPSDATQQPVVHKKKPVIIPKQDGTSPRSCVTAIEFTLDRPLHEFDESAFKLALQHATGIEAKKIRIASIRSGSTIVRVEGDSNVLEQILQRFRESQEILHQFASSTGLRKLEWSIDGSIYHLDVRNGDTLISPGIVEIDDLIDQCEKEFIDDQWDDLFGQIDAFFHRDGNVAKRYRNELVVFKRDHRENQKSFRKNTFTNEQYSVAQKQLWDRVRDMLSSLKRDLQLGHEKKQEQPRSKEASKPVNQNLQDLTGSFSRNTVSRPPFPINVPDGPQNSGSGMTCPPPADSHLSIQIPDGSTYFPIETASMPSDYQLVSDQDHTAKKTTPLPVEPDTFSVAIEALVSLLQSDSTLLNALLDATNEKEKGTLQTPLTTAEDLVRWILSSSFPLLRFGEIIGDLHLTNKRLSHDSAKKNLHICKAYFRIASLPVDDKKVVYFALQNAFLVSGKSQEGASKSIQTANKHFAEDLLISTWIQISQRSLEISEIYKLIHREPISGNPITDADRLVFATVRILSQPTDPDTSSKLSVWFAKCCWQELMGTSVMPDDPIGAVNNYIGRMAKLKAATAMYIAKDRSEAIQEIKNTFPQLVLIPLSDTDAKRYADISTEMSIVEKLIDQICRS